MSGAKSLPRGRVVDGVHWTNSVMTILLDEWSGRPKATRGGASETAWTPKGAETGLGGDGVGVLDLFWVYHI